MKKVIQSKVDALDPDFFLKSINQLGQREVKNGYCCFLNAHMAYESWKNLKLKKVVNDSLFTLPDGMSVVNAYSLLYKKRPARIDGMTYFPELLNICYLNNYNFAIVGGSQITKNEMQKRLISLKKEHLMRDFITDQINLKDEKHLNSLRNRIKAAQPDFVFVALGCPKQEFFMSIVSDINAVMFGIGGALNVYLGLQKRAPKILQRYNMEWVFRLIQEPGRLWKRYLVTNSIFIFLFLSQLLKNNEK